MEFAAPLPVIEAPGKRGAAVIAWLEGLRDSHRLGLTMWEESLGDAGDAGNTGATLDAVETKSIVQHAADYQFVVSASLVPKLGGMIPYFASLNRFNNAGYLLDLSTGRPDSAHVLLAAETDQHSGFQANRKKRRLRTCSPELRALYEESSRVLYTDCSDRWLDQLGVELQKPPIPSFWNEDNDDVNVRDHNEIHTVCSRQHVAAIVIPYYTRPPVPEWYDAGSTLFGALQGLAHLRQGQDYPVVHYHVNGLQMGGFTWIGQGDRELTQACQHAIAMLKHDPQQFEAFKQVMHKSAGGIDYAQLRENVLQLTGIDLDLPALPRALQQQESRTGVAEATRRQ